MSKKLSTMIKTSFIDTVPSDELTEKLMNAGKPKTTKRNGMLWYTAVACAVLTMSSTVVYAVNTGWLGNLFGSSAYRIEQNASDYLVKTSEFKLIENEGDFPYYFTFGDVICDGQTMFGMMNIASKNGEPVIKYSMPIELRYFERDDQEDNYESGFVYLNEKDDGSMDAAFYVVPEKEFEIGDIISIRFDEYNAIENIDSISNISYSFKILDMPETLTKKVVVGKKAKLCSYENATDTVVAAVNDLEISPLHLSVNGYCDNYDDLLTVSHATDEYSIVFADGSRFFVENRAWKLDTENSGGSSVLEIDERTSTNYGFGGTQDGSGYSFRFDVHFRCVIPVDEIVSITIGDLEIPIK